MQSQIPVFQPHFGLASLGDEQLFIKSPKSCANSFAIKTRLLVAIKQCVSLSTSRCLHITEEQENTDTSSANVLDRKIDPTYHVPK